jgi:[protein-PII] uridylyltransferase
MSHNKPNESISSQLHALLDFDSSIKQLELLNQLKNYLAISDEYLKSEFISGANVRNLVQYKSRHIDNLLLALWSHFSLDFKDNDQILSLIAVGGYGRGELHPHSDIDLLILSSNELSETHKKSLEQFISILWDFNLKVGQSVRTLNQCVEMAKNDVTITTNIMESRLLTGNKTLFIKVNQLTSPSNMWTPREFFDAKTIEQKHRYRKYDSSSFDLEPNLKSSPGGLRDIQLLGWISLRTYYPKSLFQLIQQNVITKKEYYSLMKCQLFLWQVRFSLHLVSGKSEDRLLFDHQKKTAEVMGFKDTKNSLAVEKMMKRYYRSVLVIRNISDILLQVSYQQITKNDEITKAEPIDEYFQIINKRIDAIDYNCFTKKPNLLLKVFQYVALDNSITGITSQTLRAIRAARYKITPSFRNKKENKNSFIEFWKILHTSSRAVFLMKRSGILADYLVAFQQITGQMQYDMFHSYTVDEHTLFLIKNLSDFADPEQNNQFPMCSKIMQQQKNPEIIFLAGLFHDIGKGKGGDHSEIGAIQAREFCAQHKLTGETAETIEWLVANHLLMSLIAQKRDTSDPKVINNFAELVGTQLKLDLLYILTVADIRATSNNLWNSWKDSLLKDLYLHTSHALKQDKQDINPGWLSNRNEATRLLLKKGLDLKDIKPIWKNMSKQYFSKRSPQAIAWQIEKVIKNTDKQPTLVGIKSTSHRSGSEVFVYTQDKDNLFATLTSTLNQKGLSIQAANIYTDKKGYCFDSFFVLDDQGKALTNKQTKSSIKLAIIDNINNISKVNLRVQRRMPRQFKYFSIPTKVEFFNDEYSGFTRMELTTRDQSGLLAAVGQAFKSTSTKLHDARVSTLGEKVEDTFIISQGNNQAIDSPEKRSKIRKEIQKNLTKQNTK